MRNLITIALALGALSLTACGSMGGPKVDIAEELRTMRADQQAQYAQFRAEIAELATAAVEPAVEETVAEEETTEEPVPAPVEEAVAVAPVVPVAPVSTQALDAVELARLDWYRNCVTGIMASAAETGRPVTPAHAAQACSHGGVFVGYEHNRRHEDARLAVELTHQTSEITSPNLKTLGINNRDAETILKVNLPALVDSQ